MGDVSFFLVFLAIVLIGATALIGTDIGAGLMRKRRSQNGLIDDGFDEPVASLPPVLLPADAKPADVDHVRFSLGLRGYRMDQVDEVLDDLRDQLASKDDQLAAKDAEIASRDAELAGLREQLRTNVLSASSEDLP